MQGPPHSNLDFGTVLNYVLTLSMIIYISLSLFNTAVRAEQNFISFHYSVLCTIIAKKEKGFFISSSFDTSLWLLGTSTLLYCISYCVLHTKDVTKDVTHAKDVTYCILHTKDATKMSHMQKHT